MTKDNALSLCIRLKANFPRMSDELVDEWHERLVGFDFAIARQCVARYVEKYEELRTSALIGLLRDATNRASAPRADEREQDRRTAAEHAAIDAAIAEMPDAVLAEHKRRVLMQMPETARAFHVNRDPRKSMALKSLIAVRVGLGASYLGGPGPIASIGDGVAIDKFADDVVQVRLGRAEKLGAESPARGDEVRVV